MLECSVWVIASFAVLSFLESFHNILITKTIVAVSTDECQWQEELRIYNI